MKELQFFDELSQYFQNLSQYPALKTHLLPQTSPAFFTQREMLFNSLLKLLLQILKIPYRVESKYKELRPLYNLYHKIDPQYFTERNITNEIKQCYTIPPNQQKALAKYLANFFNLIGNPQFTQPHSKWAWEPWYDVFPPGYAWEAVRVFYNLGANVSSSWKGFRAWYRYTQGIEPPSENSPLDWQHFCQEWASKEKQWEMLPDLLSQAFSGELKHLKIEGFCDDTPFCEKCPLKTSCSWANPSHDVDSIHFSIWEKIQKQQIQEISTMTLVGWIFSLDSTDQQTLEGRFDHHNSLRDWDQKKLHELSQTLPKFHHFGEKFKALLELCKRYNEETLTPGDPFNCSADIFHHFRFRLRDLKQELFILVLLNNKHQYLTDVVITKGILNKSLVHPREVFSSAIEHRAAAIICVHNHPSGDPKASKEDLQITRRLTEVSKIVGIPLLDHIIIGDDRYYSLADQGLL